jgi:hypothetical protein
MMHYQSNSCLRPGDKDYGHKTLLNTYSKTLRTVKDLVFTSEGARVQHRSAADAARQAHRSVVPAVIASQGRARGGEREIMHYQSSSCLRPGDRDYSHKTLLYIESEALGNTKDRGECVWMARLGAGSSQYPDLAIYGDARSTSNQQRVSLDGVEVALGNYKKRSCSRYYLKGYRAKRRVNVPLSKTTHT